MYLYQYVTHINSLPHKCIAFLYCSKWKVRWAVAKLSVDPFLKPCLLPSTWKTRFQERSNELSATTWRVQTQSILVCNCHLFILLYLDFFTKYPRLFRIIQIPQKCDSLSLSCLTVIFGLTSQLPSFDALVFLLAYLSSVVWPRESGRWYE